MSVRKLSPQDPAIEPPLPHPPYKSTLLRAPTEPPVVLDSDPAITAAITPSVSLISENELTDLTAAHTGEPIGQRIIVTGQVLDERRRPVVGALVELWQANASGRYAHAHDQWDAPLDPNFSGTGYRVTDDAGRYRFMTIRPGAYPWGNHHNAWRPAHIHFSLLGPSIGARLITQMYFPDDPLIEDDPIANAIALPYRNRLIARLDDGVTVHERALGYRFDLIVRGDQAVPFERET